MKFELILISLIICKVTCNQSEKLLKRNKRWDSGGRGVAGVDYPNLQSVPTTNFRCEDQISNKGYYADVETGCQVFHVCREGGKKNSLLCARETIFSQEILACDFWYKTDCGRKPNFWSGGQLQQNNHRQNAANNYQYGRYRLNEPATSFHVNISGSNWQRSATGKWD